MKSLSISRGARAELALDLETVKSDLRISGNQLDEILSSQYIPAAIAWGEGATRRGFVSHVVTWVIGDFPRGTDLSLYLPGPPVTAVASVAYVLNGSTVTLTGPTSSPAGTGFQEYAGDTEARLLPPQGETWPDVDLDAIAPVTVTYTAGWATAAAVPADIKRALTANVYQAMELDGLLTLGRSTVDMDHADQLISAYRSPLV